MDFYAILDQVITLLKQRGRVSYRALKVQFHLDDEALEALKDELIEVHQLARDQDGRMLVWTGEAGTTPEPTIVQSAQQEVRLEDLRTPVEVPPPEPRSPEAERRQLTVMFCDLVDSTRLSSQLDPEDWRDVVRAYQRVCTEVIQRYDGHIAQLLGDGLLVYFGYPQAHEDDAHRAIRTGLGILDAMGDLNTRLRREQGIQLGVRLGIHTGLVVVGDMGGAGRQEQLALGEVPNIGSRVEGLAAPNTVAISDTTYRLVQGYFDCEALGEQTLRGVAEPVHVYRVLQESGARGRLDVAVTRGLTPLVGREQEVGLLLERWAQVKAGHGHVVLLTGDAGIGKSRLVQTLKDHVANEPHTRWECRSLSYFENTALFPLADLFQRFLQFQAEDTSDEKLSKLEHALSQYRLPLEESVQLLAPLLSVSIPEHHSPPLNLSPQHQRQKTLESLVAILLELAEHQPVLFILEDLHWTDPTTLEWLNLLIDQTPTVSLLVLLTCRPHFQPRWSHKSYLSEVTVHRLSHAQGEQIVTRMTDGKDLPREVLQQILAKTDGVPLFVEEMTKAILESGQLTAVNGHYERTGALSTFAIPATLQDSLMARLDRLMTGKVIAQLGATIGRQFPYALLQHVSQLDGLTLQRELGRLVEAELVYQRGVPPQATYTFKHALVQDAAYESLLKSTRQQYHHRIAQVLEAQFPETTAGQPELLAHHYTEAGLIAQAVGYRQQAGQSAVQRSAYLEATAHLRQGLALLATLPETPEHTQREVDMLISLGVSLSVTKGFGAPEVEHTFRRAQHLCAHLEAPPQLFPALRGLWAHYLVRAELQTAQALGEQLLSWAQHAQNLVRCVAARSCLGMTLMYLGAVTAAHTHFTQGLALYDPEQHRATTFLYGGNAGVTCHSFSAWTLWFLGYPDQGLAQSQQAVTLAQQIAHPFCLAEALFFAAMLHQFRREVRAVQERAEASILLFEEQAFPLWRAIGPLLRGWALAHQGQAQAGIAQLTEGLSAFRATGVEIGRPWRLVLLADAHRTTGGLHAGLDVLNEALALVDTTAERWCAAEIYRVKGELLLQCPVENATEAETCFHQAVYIAQNQSAKSWELRAATSLARLWQQQGKRQAAHDLLAPVYEWFTEGFDTADLKDAKALLDALA